MSEVPSALFECKCGQPIHKQAGDDELICYECSRSYDPVFNTLSAIHVLCPECSAKITEFGLEKERDGGRWRVDDVDCPRCSYEFVTW